MSSEYERRSDKYLCGQLELLADWPLTEKRELEPVRKKLESRGNDPVLMQSCVRNDCDNEIVEISNVIREWMRSDFGANVELPELSSPQVESLECNNIKRIRWTIGSHKTKEHVKTSGLVVRLFVCANRDDSADLFMFKSGRYVSIIGDKKTIGRDAYYHCADSNGLEIGDELVCYWGQFLISIPVAEDHPSRRPDRRAFIRDNLIVEIEGQTLMPNPHDGKWESRGFSWDDKKRIDRLLAEIDKKVCNGAAICKP
ncbi:MAG: hypothetical protein KDA54_20120 [Phycisphaerales bacterium]|nr:hypothetical protein [Phycisphaerales bacterium]